MPRRKTVYYKRQTNLSWSVCAALTLFCFPIGLVAILVSCRSKKAWDEERPEAASELGNLAKTLSLVTILFSVTVFIFIVALIASGLMFKLLNKAGLMDESTVRKLTSAQGSSASSSHEDNIEPAYYYYEDYEITADY